MVSADPKECITWPQGIYPDDIPALTSLRFFAAMAVFLFHLNVYFPLPHNALTGLFSKGYLGVDFFFILSGYILTHVYGPQFAHGRFSVRRFINHRLARIYPVHFFLLCIAGMVGLYHPADWNVSTDFPAFVGNVLLVHAWGIFSGFSFNSASWSISLEWFAYLLFPALLMFFVVWAKRYSILWALIFFCVAADFSNMFTHKAFTENTISYGELRIFPEFCLGIAVYLFSLRHPWKTSMTVIVCLFLTVIGLLYVGAPTYAIVFVYAVIIYAAAGLSLCRFSILSARPLVYLGEISYSFYMVHVMFMYAMWRLWKIYGGLEFWLIACFLLTLVLAAAIHHFIEIPGRAILRSLAKA